MPTPQPENSIYIADRDALQALTQRLGAAERVALDTEADSLHHYYEKVCLMQLSAGGDHYLVDPLSELDLGEFLDTLARKPLIVHGGDYDLRMMRASLGFRPYSRVFDTMIAAQLLGLEEIGLGALLGRFVGVTIGKEGQKSDWSRRPLSREQLRYATDDTRYLEPLAERLREELRARGRLGWHEESCRAMVEATGRDSSRDPEEAWRIKGSGLLSRRQLAYLRELWSWRDQMARRADLPPFKIFGNDPMLALVRWADNHPGVPLSQGPKLPRNIHGSRLKSLEEAIERAASMPAHDWPEPRRGNLPNRITESLRPRINELRERCAGIARELEIAPSTLAPRAALEAIAASAPRSVDEVMKAGGLLRWQAELVHPAVASDR